MKPPRIWIITADGARARFFLKEGASFTEMSGFSQHHARSGELGHGKPGSSFDSMSSSRHAGEPHKDLHQAAEDDFLKPVAQKIMAEAKAYDRVVLIAAPRALGTLRKLMQPLSVRLDEIAKDLTHLDAKPLQEALADTL